MVVCPTRTPTAIRTLTQTLSRTLRGDPRLDVVACEGYRLIRPACALETHTTRINFPQFFLLEKIPIVHSLHDTHRTSPNTAIRFLSRRKDSGEKKQRRRCSRAHAQRHMPWPRQPYVAPNTAAHFQYRRKDWETKKMQRCSWGRVQP